MPAFSLSDRDRLARRGGIPFTTLLVLTIVSALTGAVVTLVLHRILERGQAMGMPSQAAPPAASPAAPAQSPVPPVGAEPSPLAAVGASLSARRVAELERLLAEDDVVAGDGTDTCPPEFPIKANGRSGIYHPPGALAYPQTHPTLCFRTAESAERAGFRPAKR